MNKSKMYILIKDSIDLGHAILGAAHASLSGYLTFEANEDKFEVPLASQLDLWATQSFRKVVCKVSNEEFEKAKTFGKNMIDYRIMVESGLDNAEVSIVFYPKENWDPFFKTLKLYK